jgi:hypothetical protein
VKKVHVTPKTTEEIKKERLLQDQNKSYANYLKVRFCNKPTNSRKRIKVSYIIPHSTPPARVLRKVFGPKRDEVTGEWRKLHNEDLNDLYSLPNIVRVVKSRRIRWAGHVERCAQGFGGGSLRKGDHWGDPDVDGRTILRRIFRKWEGLWGLDGAGSG